MTDLYSLVSTAYGVEYGAAPLVIAAIIGGIGAALMLIGHGIDLKRAA